MILGTQWYILFNVIAGASAFPGDLQEAARNLQVGGGLWWRRVILPGIFPYYVTGAITASGRLVERRHRQRGCDLGQDQAGRRTAWAPTSRTRRRTAIRRGWCWGSP